MAAATFMCWGCNSSPIHASHPKSFLGSTHKRILISLNLKYHHGSCLNRNLTQPRFLLVSASANSSKSEEESSVPSWARPDSNEPLPWARDEGQQKDETQNSLEIPFYAYLLASAITAIAAIGSVFEYVNQRPVFGILYSDSIFYAPLLGLFAFTGIPTSAFLWFKSVQAANKEAEEQDKRDGYL